MGEGVQLRPVTAVDRPFLFSVYAATREEELADVGWSAEERESFLRQQFEAQDHHYRENYPGASLSVVERAGEPIGRLYVARWPAEIRIMDIALLPGHRGRRIGSGLLSELLAEGAASSRRVTIHVEAFNPARRLYERMGFRPAGERGVYVFMEWCPQGGGDARPTDEP